jgi:hypothetical protein
MSTTYEVLDIVLARLGIDGPLLGAAELALDRALADPATVPYARGSTWPTRGSRPTESKEVTLGTA